MYPHKHNLCLGTWWTETLHKMKQKVLFTFMLIIISVGAWGDNVNGIRNVYDNEDFSDTIDIDVLKYAICGEEAKVIGISSERDFGTDTLYIAVPETISYRGQDYAVKEIDLDKNEVFHKIGGWKLPVTINKIGELFKYYMRTRFVIYLGEEMPEITTEGKNAIKWFYLKRKKGIYAGLAAGNYGYCILKNYLNEEEHTAVIYGTITDDKSCFQDEKEVQAFWNLMDDFTIPSSLFKDDVEYHVIGVQGIKTPGLHVLRVPEGVVEVGERAFWSGFPTEKGSELQFQTNTLEEVYFPSTLRTIGRWAFQFGYNLKQVHIQEGIDSIGDGAFTYCFNLNSLHLPASLRYLGEGQSWLSSCTDITVSESNNHIALYDGVLFDKKKDKLLQYPSSREGESYRIPDGVKTIMGYAFEGATHLKVLTVPASVDSMGYLWMVYTLPKEIRMESSVPPISGAISFDHQGFSGSWLYPNYDFYNVVTLHVPAGCKEIYANTKPWNQFANIVDDITGIEGTDVITHKSTTDIYNLQGQRMAEPQRGVNIIRNSDGTTKKVLVE